MLAIFRSKSLFTFDKTKGRFRDWLGGVVRNTAAMLRRRPDRRIAHLAQPLSAEARPEELLVDEKGAAPDAQWEAAFERNVLASLLDLVRKEVSPKTYQAFEFTAIHGLSGEATAELTGQTRNAVYLARAKVLRRLKELGAGYRREGRLCKELQAIMAEDPGASLQRKLITRTQTNMLNGAMPLDRHGSSLHETKKNGKEV
jgi:RNA polymerase sigma-70 factor (ECF subfamily)